MVLHFLHLFMLFHRNESTLVYSSERRGLHAVIAIWILCAHPAAPRPTRNSISLWVSPFHMRRLHLGLLSLRRAETVIFCVASISVSVRVQDTGGDLLRWMHNDWSSTLLDEPLILKLLDPDDGAVSDGYLSRARVRIDSCTTIRWLLLLVNETIELLIVVYVFLWVLIGNVRLLIVFEPKRFDVSNDLVFSHSDWRVSRWIQMPWCYCRWSCFVVRHRLSDFTDVCHACDSIVRISKDILDSLGRCMLQSISIGQLMLSNGRFWFS